LAEHDEIADLPRSRRVVVAALGTSQTLAWASSYYLPAILADPIAAGIDVPRSWVFGAFSGSLLMPLKSSASSHLDRGTGVSGSGTEAQGRTSLVVSEIVIDGSHYKLKSQAGAGSARSAGSGGVVSFDSGKVFEMWLSSDSIYEREAAVESPRQ